VFNDIVANNRRVVIKIVNYGGVTAFYSTARNGFTSTAGGSGQGSQLLDFIYYDYTLNKMMRCNPLSLPTPVEWDGTFQ